MKYKIWVLGIYICIKINVTIWFVITYLLWTLWGSIPLSDVINSFVPHSLLFHTCFIYHAAPSWASDSSLWAGALSHNHPPGVELQ